MNLTGSAIGDIHGTVPIMHNVMPGTDEELW